MPVPFESLKESYAQDGFTFTYSGTSTEGMYIYDVTGPGFDADEIHLSAQPPADAAAGFTDYHFTPERWDVGAVHLYYTRSSFSGRDLKLPTYEREQVLAWLTAEKKASLNACAAAFWGAIQHHALELAANAPAFVPHNAQGAQTTQSTQSTLRADAAAFVPAGAGNDEVPVRGPCYTAANRMYWLDDQNQPYYIASDGQSYPGYPPD